MADYALYLDDSGTKEFAPSPELYGTGISRYFVFGGALLTTVEAGRLARQLKRLKNSTFGNDRVEIKSNWLRIPREREKRYLNRFGVTDADIEMFTHALYEEIALADLRLFAAVVDKIHLQEDYSRPWYAPAVAYEILMQRIAQQVLRPDTVAVTIDDMMGATPKGSQYRDNLQRHHKQLCNTGTTLLRRRDVQISFDAVKNAIRFMDSADSEIIQVADIVAYNVYRQFVDHGNDWEFGGDVLPTYKWFDIIANKFCQGIGGRVQGYGVVKFPLRNRMRWAVGGE